MHFAPRAKSRAARKEHQPRFSQMAQIEKIFSGNLCDLRNLWSIASCILRAYADKCGASRLTCSSMEREGRAPRELFSDRPTPPLVFAACSCARCRPGERSASV